MAIPGNHDGVVYAADPAPTLAAFLANFCAPSFAPSPDAGGLARTTMIQPGVYFTFDAPFVRILGVYSNVLEDPGVISGQNGTYPKLDSRQIDFLQTALARVKSENYTGAVIIAVHHPPFTGGSTHGGSSLMLQDIDDACQAAGVWPHAVFSGHSHNYQRFTRTVNGLQIPYLVAGCGGHAPLAKIIIAVLLGCGLRRSEVAALTMGHIQQRDGRWVILDLVSKHKRVRTAPMPTWVKVAIDAWTVPASVTNGHVFRPIHRGDQLQGDRMSEKVVWQLLRPYAAVAGVPGIAPHDLRRSCAKMCRAGGGELEQIQLLLGHASVQTTERYLGTKQDLLHAPNDQIRLRVVV